MKRSMLRLAVVFFLVGMVGWVVQALPYPSPGAEVSEPIHIRVIWTHDPATRALMLAQTP